MRRLTLIVGLIMLIGVVQSRAPMADTTHDCSWMFLKYNPKTKTKECVNKKKSGTKQNSANKGLIRSQKLNSLNGQRTDKVDSDSTQRTEEVNSDNQQRASELEQSAINRIRRQHRFTRDLLAEQRNLRESLKAN